MFDLGQSANFKYFGTKGVGVNSYYDLMHMYRFDKN